MMVDFGVGPQARFAVPVPASERTRFRSARSP